MSVHDPYHDHASPPARESGDRVALSHQVCRSELVQVVEGKRTEVAERLNRARVACNPPVSQREMANAIGVQHSRMAEWCACKPMPAGRLLALLAAIPRLARAWNDLATELEAPLPAGEDPAFAALDVSAKAGELAGLVRAKAPEPEVARASQDVITSARRVRVAVRGRAA